MQLPKPIRLVRMQAKIFIALHHPENSHALTVPGDDDVGCAKLGTFVEQNRARYGSLAKPTVSEQL